jgi:hypothetical protein
MCLPRGLEFVIERLKFRVSLTLDSRSGMNGSFVIRES